MLDSNPVQAVIKPPMAKIADVFGRFEAFSLAVFIYVIGYIQQAASNNVKTFAAAQIFYSAGWTGLQILQQVFIADTSDLLNRALFSTIPDLPFLVTVWAGPPIAQRLIDHSTWRWGYGIWAIVLPVAFSPLAFSLFLNQRKAAKLHSLPKTAITRRSMIATFESLWFELDFFGLCLLSAAISLILLPLTLASLAKGGWSNGSMIAMLVVGCICLICFPFWERSKKLAPRAFFPSDLFTNRTVLAGILIAFFYFSQCGICTPCYSRLTKHSGFLPLRLPLLLFLSPHRSRQINHSGRPYNPNFYLYIYCHGNHCFFHHQIYSPLQVLHHAWYLHLPLGRWPHDSVPCSGSLHRGSGRLSDRVWHRRRPDKRTCTTGCTSLGVPPKGRCSNCRLPYDS